MTQYVYTLNLVLITKAYSGDMYLI